MPVNVFPQEEQCVVSESGIGKEGDNGDIGVFVGDPSNPLTVSSSEALVRVQDVVKLVLEVGEAGETDAVAFGRMTANTLALGQ